jgi:phytoene dehydrogenase-like protein
MGLDQLFSARPMIGAADYRMPLKGLYLCGSGAHPGGGVTGAPGHNAAHAFLSDRRLWKRRH